MFADDVRSGLTAEPKRLDPRYFYDALGSALFAAICELPEYYVTRSEREILERRAGEIVNSFGNVDRVVELGSGSARKTQLLLDPLLRSRGTLVYQPVDVDPDVLDLSARELAIRFPSLTVAPICSSFDDIRSAGTIDGNTVILFLGSSIGNLDHATASSLLRGVKSILHRGDAVFVGFDLIKDRQLLESAYNDSLGVTAAFNLNLLARINRELGGKFILGNFSHLSFFNEAESRIEMHLVSKDDQTVAIGNGQITFEAGETIHTENSYKYDVPAIEALAAAAGLRIEKSWTDSRGWFADVLMRVGE